MVLIVWQKSHLLTLAIYQITKTFPGEEIYGLTSQIRRFSVSVPSNLSEGCGRLSEKNSLTFLSSQAALPQNWTTNLFFYQKT